jgi:hypothetical protein
MFSDISLYNDKNSLKLKLNGEFDQDKEGTKIHRENCYRTQLFFSVCQNTPLNYVFARYHYNFVAHLPEYTT